MSVNESAVVNGTQTVLSCFDYEVLMIAYIAAFFSGISNFIRWKYLCWNNCLQDEILEKASQLFYCRHGHVRSGVSDFHASS